ncbi:MAG TPA: hypothetical protein VF680_01740 [Allosphingosinicella sp.]|jgi:hypothetical protein
MLDRFPKLAVAENCPENLVVECLLSSALRDPIESSTLKLLNSMKHALACKFARHHPAGNLPLNKQAQHPLIEQRLSQL